jgi:hypothetical protein
VRGNPIRSNDPKGTDDQDQTTPKNPSVQYQSTGDQATKDTGTVLGAVGKAILPEVQKLPVVKQVLDQQKAQFSRLKPPDIAALAVGGVLLGGGTIAGLTAAGDQKVFGLRARTAGIGLLSLGANLGLGKLTDDKLKVELSNTKADGATTEEWKGKVELKSRTGDNAPGTTVSVGATLGPTNKIEVGFHQTYQLDPSIAKGTVTVGFTTAVTQGKPASTIVDLSARLQTPLGRLDLGASAFFNKEPDKPGLVIPQKISDVGGQASFGLGPHFSGTGAEVKATLHF